MSRRTRLTVFMVAIAGLAGLLGWGIRGLPAFGHYQGGYGNLLERLGRRAGPCPSRSLRRPPQASSTDSARASSPSPAGCSGFIGVGCRTLCAAAELGSWDPRSTLLELLTAALLATTSPGSWWAPRSSAGSGHSRCVDLRQSPRGMFAQPVHGRRSSLPPPNRAYSSALTLSRGD
jgi:hypothetical protein